MSIYKRIYKKKLKGPNELETSTSKLISYFHKNSKPIIFITLIILILISSWGGLRFYKDSLAEKTSKEIYYALKELDPLKEVPPEKIEKLKKLEGSYLFKSGYSNLYLGHFYYKNGKYEDAIKEYKRVIESESSQLMKDMASLGIGYSYEALGQYKEAINLFSKNLNEKDENLKEEIYISLGRFYEKLGDNKSALEKYQIVIEKFPQSRNIEAIKEKIWKFKIMNI
jgi:tetratricopeptide (TPR) repeat protein